MRKRHAQPCWQCVAHGFFSRALRTPCTFAGSVQLVLDWLVQSYQVPRILQHEVFQWTGVPSRGIMLPRKIALSPMKKHPWALINLPWSLGQAHKAQNIFFCPWIWQKSVLNGLLSTERKIKRLGIGLTCGPTANWIKKRGSVLGFRNWGHQGIEKRPRPGTSRKARARVSPKAKSHQEAEGERRSWG